LEKRDTGLADKSKLEIAVSVATLLVAAWWGYVGFVYSKAKDNFDADTKRFDIYSQLFAKCTSQTSGDQQASVRYFGMLTAGVVGEDVIKEIFGSKENLHNLSESCLRFTSNNQAVSKSLGATVDPSPAQIEAVEKTPALATKANKSPPSSPSAPPNQGDRFWIFVGTFKSAADGSGGQWSSKYITIDDRFDPRKFVAASDPKQGIYKVVNDVTTLNVRFGSFGPYGEFPPVTNKPLKTGQDVHLKSMAQWFDGDSWWATIEPPS
jgi:hypothetical protein